VPLFSSNIFVLSLLYLGVFFIGGLYLEPLIFRCASFFYQTSFVGSHLCLEVSLFSSEMFYLNPLMYRGASFFIGDLYLDPLASRSTSFFIESLLFGAPCI
jgi:hypothetical protein